MKWSSRILRIERIKILDGMCCSLNLVHLLIVSMYVAAFQSLRRPVLAHMSVSIALMYACNLPAGLLRE